VKGSAGLTGVVSTMPPVIDNRGLPGLLDATGAGWRLVGALKANAGIEATGSVKSVLKLGTSTFVNGKKEHYYETFLDII